MDEKKSTQTVSEIVRKDYRTAEVFKKYGINYCCGGNQTLEEACVQKNLAPINLQEELTLATTTVCLPGSVSYNDWPVDFLIDYISFIHHAYLKQTLPTLNSFIKNYVQGHKQKYPQLEPIPQIVEELSSLLLEYLQHDETTIFPYLRMITNTYKRKETYGRLFVRTLSKPMDQVKQLEYTHISASLAKLRQVTKHYQFPTDACTNYQVVFHRLKELDHNIVQYKYLENNFLLPKALQTEKELLHL